MVRSFASRVVACAAALILGLSSSGQALAHAEAHVHLAAHEIGHADGVTGDQHFDDAAHHDDDHEAAKEWPELFAADHPQHSHAEIELATVKRELPDTHESITLIVPAPVALQVQSVGTVAASSLNAAMLPRPGPDPGPPSGSRAPPTC